MSVILAIDPAQNCGVCAGKPGSTPYVGLWKLPVTAKPGEQLAALHGAVADAIVEFAPTRIVVEADITLHRRNPNATAYQQIGMVAVIEMVAWMHDVPMHIASASDARMKMLGRTRWPKKGDCKIAVLEWCKDQGLDIVDHNVGDAFLLWRYAAAGGRARLPLLERVAA
jgi:hypothetical protein